MKRVERKSRHPIVESLCEVLAQPLDKEERAKAKERAFEQKYFGRIDAIAKEIRPTLRWQEEFQRMADHFRKAARTAPKRPPRSAKEIEQEERDAHDIHPKLMKPPFRLTSKEADQFIGRGMYKGERTSQNRRKAHAVKLRETDEKKPKK